MCDIFGAEYNNLSARKLARLGDVFLFLTPQGLNMPAQVKALGMGGYEVFSPERALHIFGLLWLVQNF